MNPKNRKSKTEKTVQKENIFEKLPSKIKYSIAILIILVPATFIFSPYLFNNMRPSGTDVIASKGETNLINEWRQETGETPLWNTGIFAGMPIYQRLSPAILHMDTLISKLGSIAYWGYLYFLVGAFGIFSLLIYRKIPWYFAVIVAIAFTLLPDWQSLVGDGHFTKLRAVMIFPWLILTFNYLIDKNSWFGAAAFAFVFSWTLRTQHFQIVFYGILILAFLFIYPFVKLFIDKESKKGIGIFVKFLVAIVLTVLTASQPFLSIKEYTPYSTRGGNPVVLDKELETAQQSGGVSFDYATKWSLAPAEIMDFFIQRFHGGISGETYDGTEYPQFKGRQVPGYWGEKPFSGNYAYIGMIVFLFAVIGVIRNRKDIFVVALTVFTVFSLFLSFGRHFPELYKLFFYYLPYFSKFRAPAMMANITFISLLILSGYGMKSFLAFEYPKDTKLLAGILGAALFVPLIVLFLKSGFSYLLPSETKQYDSNTITLIKNIREEFLTADTMKLLWIMLIASGVMLLYFFRKIRVELFAGLVLILVLFELGTANGRAADKIELVSQDQLTATLIQTNSVTDYLKKLPQTDRAIVLGREFQSNQYSYFYPTINGYSAIKMQNIQDIIDNNLFSAQTQDKINWNIINMLGGKYVVLNQNVMMPNLKPIVNDGKNFLYQNVTALPKAWFVHELKSFDSAENIVKEMNNPDFDPANEAFFLKNSSLKDAEYDSTGTIVLKSNNPNSLEFEVSGEEKGFLVISEIYYPEGWKAFLDGNEIPVYKINHLLRGLEIPAGNHNLEMVFQPATYFAGLKMVWTGDIIIIVMLILFFILENENIRNKIFTKKQEVE